MSTVSFEYVTLARTACFGPCPVYKFVMHRSGKFAYYGEMFVSTIGLRKSLLNDSVVRKVDELIQNYAYFAFSPIKGSDKTTDNPSCITSVKMMDGRIKKIENNYGDKMYPKELTAFEDSLDSAVNIRSLTGTALFLYYVSNGSSWNDPTSDCHVVIAATRDDAIRLCFDQIEQYKHHPAEMRTFRASKLGKAEEHITEPRIMLSKFERNGL